MCAVCSIKKDYEKKLNAVDLLAKVFQYEEIVRMAREEWRVRQDNLDRVLQETADTITSYHLAVKAVEEAQKQLDEIYRDNSEDKAAIRAASKVLVAADNRVEKLDQPNQGKNKASSYD